MSEMALTPVEVIDQYGWKQNGYGSTDEGFCLVGAYVYAKTGLTVGKSINPLRAYETVFRCVDLASKYLGLAKDNFLSWQDSPHRTKEEIIIVLEAIQGVSND